MASYNVSALPAYVDEHKSELIGQVVLGPSVTDYFDLWTGVKGNTTINVLDIDTDDLVQCGASCGWNDGGGAVLSQRTIKPGIFKINMSICDKNLLNKYAGYLVKVEAGKTDADLPFEKELTDEVIKAVKKTMNGKIWNATTAGDCGMEGLLAISDITSVTKAQGQNGVQAVTAAMICAGIKEGEIYLSCSDYFTYVQSLVNANLYHYNPGQALTDYQVFVPGTNYRVVMADGLGAGTVFGSASKNIVYAVDMENGDEQFDLWFSKDNREFRLAIEFVAGVNVKNPALAFKTTY